MEPGPRRRLDADTRRTAILEAARGLYAKAPYGDIPTSRVAEAAGASQALVFHYFGSKAGLYAAVVQAAVDELARAETDAIDALAPSTPPRERIRAGLEAFLSHVAAHPGAWAAPLTGGEEPSEALAVRRAARDHYADALRRMLRLNCSVRDEYAVLGHLGFLDQACLHWVEKGCPDADRAGLVETVLGALEGALGDWGR